MKIQRHPETHVLRVEWADDHVCEMHYEYLRRACPCAICTTFCGRSAPTREGASKAILFESFRDIRDLLPRILKISYVALLPQKVMWKSRPKATSLSCML
jgi:hypothetical protein